MLYVQYCIVFDNVISVLVLMQCVLADVSFIETVFDNVISQVFLHWHYVRQCYLYWQCAQRCHIMKRILDGVSFVDNMFDNIFIPIDVHGTLCLFPIILHLTCCIVFDNVIFYFQHIGLSGKFSVCVIRIVFDNVLDKKRYTNCLTVCTFPRFVF